jgi:excisionase family DNA binding protein
VSESASDVFSAEAARILGISEQTLRNWVRSGRLVPRRLGERGIRVFDREELERIAAVRKAAKAGL